VFDGFGRPVLSATSEDGRHASAADFTVFTTTVYDALGRVKMATNPYRAEAASTDGWVRNTYDLAGRLTEAATFAGGVSAPPPDAGTNRNWTGSIVKTYGGDVTTVRDQANKQRRSTTDGLGRLKSVDEMLEYPSTTVYATTGYAYDARGNLKIVSQGRQTRTFAYDGLSRLKSATNPEVCAQQATGGCSPVPVTFAYDAASNLKSKTDARGVITSYDYDALNRPVTRSYSAPAGLPSTPAVTYAYDTAPNGTGRLASVTSSVSAYSYDSYDAIGRVKSSTQTTDGQRYRMSYAYDLAGNLTSEKYPSGRTVTSTIDPAGRLDNVSSGQSPCAAGGAGTCYASSLTYAASGAVLGVTLGNGLRERTAFNNRLQPTEIGIRNVATNSDLLKLDYAYETLDANNNSLGDNNGNLRSQTITVPGLAAPLVQSYQYDHLNRLKSAEELKGAASQWKQVYSYDRYGNRRLAVGTTFPALTGNLNDPVHNPQIDEATNRLLEDQNDDGQRDYVYDAAGNVVRDALGRTFSYDADNMQVTFNGGPDINTGGASYSYDAAGRRVKKVTLAGTTVFVYDAAGKLVAEYSNEAPQPGEGGTKYLTEDNLGSPRVVTDKDGRVVSRHDYAPFGEDLGEKLPASRTAEYKQDSVRQQFTGQEHDRDSGLDYFNARYYSSTQGRFTSIDPLAASGQAGNPQSWNRYAYVLNNPLKFIDSTGMVPVQADSTKAKNGPGVVILFPVRRVEIVGRTPDGKAEIGKIVTDYVKAGDNIQKAANALYDHYVDRRLEVQANLEKAGRDADRIANGSSPMPKTQAFIDDLFKSAATGKESTGNLEKAFDKEKDNTPTVNVGIGGDVNERDFKAEMEVTKVFAAEGIEEKHIPDTLEAIKKAAINQADNLIDARRGRKPPQ
jgi:RHS repeat-associated protein